MNLKDFRIELSTLVIFDSLLDTDVMYCLEEVLEADRLDEETFIALYSRLCAQIYKVNPCFSTYIYDYVMNDENVFITTKAANHKVSKAMEAALKNELDILERLSKLSSKDLLKGIHYDKALPTWEVKKYNLKDDYYQRIDELSTRGYGVFARYYVFGVGKNGLFPIKHPDPQSLKEMTGYERERNLLIRNTKAFIKGMKANNALLYGDAGTGKSSSIKAIVNEYHEQGLRLIEVKKHQIALLPDVIEALSGNPLKFIVFIDDLSFSRNDDNFIALKNILEGGTVSNKANIVVYATSNRRHLIKENMEDRSGGELFRNDSIQETMSLAARFGLTITFSKPEKQLYLEIVKNLAKEYNLLIDEQELFTRAEAFAIRNSGRSPRTARQFVEFEKINNSLK